MQKTGSYRVSQKTVRLTVLGVLTALMIVMAFTPLGYLKLGVVEITLYAIPVAVGAVLFGKYAGLYLGTLFGITSFIQCFGMSAFGTMLFSINPVFAFLLCIAPRAFMGYITGVIYEFAERKIKNSTVNYALSSFCCSLANTLGFMLLLIIFFYNSEYIQGIAQTLGTSNIFSFTVLFVGINGLLEMVAATVICPPVIIGVKSFLKRI